VDDATSFSFGQSSPPRKTLARHPAKLRRVVDLRLWRNHDGGADRGDRILGLGPQESATLAQEEASYITKKIAYQAAVQGKNIVIDSSMKSDSQFSKYRDIINSVSKTPYTSTMILIDASKDESLKQATGRYVRGGRFLPLDIIRNMPVDDQGRTAPRVVFDTHSGDVDRAILVSQSRQVISDSKPGPPVTTTPEMLASMHSNDLRNPDGGFTLDPLTGKSPPGTGDFGPEGGPYAVAVGFPHSSGAIAINDGTFKRDAEGYSPAARMMAAFVTANADKLKESGMYVGGWHAVDKDGNDLKELHFDVTQVIPRGPGALESATALGAERNQIAITDLNDFTSIPTGGTGKDEKDK
jgi:hypothetical protein